MRKLLFLLVLAVLLFSCKSNKNEFKVAFVYVGSINDGGWTQAHDEGRKELEHIFPNVKTAYVENVPEGAEAERVITSFAQKGYNLIFTTSFGFMDPTINVAKKFPDTIFMHCSGYKRSTNVGTYFGAMEEAKYLAGIIAGKMSKKNLIGFVAPHPIPEVIRHINAFTIGVRKVNPKAKVKVIWTNSWFDTVKEKEASYSLIDAGCDVIATGCDSSSALLAAEERGVYCIGYDSDAREVAKKTFLTAPMWNWISVYKDVVEKAMKKEIKDYSNVDYYDGFNKDVIKLAPLTDLVPADVKDLVEKEKARIISGEEKIFVGPMKKQDGSVYLKDKEVSPLSELLSMMFFVEGVDGVIPGSTK